MNVSLTKGITLVEVVLGIAMISGVLVTVALTLTVFMQSADLALERTSALYLAEEGIAVMQYLRSDDWDTISAQSVGTPFYLTLATSTIGLSGSPEVIAGTYTRRITLNNLYRNSSGDIVGSGDAGASVDADARYVLVEVATTDATTSLEAILTNFHAY